MVKRSAFGAEVPLKPALLDSQVPMSTQAGFRVRHFGFGEGLLSFATPIVPTAGFRLLFALVILRHERRLISPHVTAHPMAEWIARQIGDAFPWDEAPDYLEVFSKDRGITWPGDHTAGRDQ
jgi:hypothetical protein